MSEKERTVCFLGIGIICELVLNFNNKFILLFLNQLQNLNEIEKSTIIKSVLAEETTQAL